MSARSAASSVQEVLALYDRWGSERYDEDVTQTSHALQVGGHAIADGAPDALVVAALLHDVGHLLVMESRGNGEPGTDADLRHEARGARWLALLFPSGVTRPIALHVQAKRYRCAVEPDALAALSAGSQASLQRQGGVMSTAEQQRFEALPAASDALRLRSWDDSGKMLGLVSDDVAAHEVLLVRVAERRLAKRTEGVSQAN